MEIKENILFQKVAGKPMTKNKTEIYGIKWMKISFNLSTIGFKMKTKWLVGLLQFI